MIVSNNHNYNHNNNQLLITITFCLIAQFVLLRMKHFVKHSGSNRENQLLFYLKTMRATYRYQLAKYKWITFYPRTIHKMQSLDGGVFDTFKTNYNTKMNKWMLKLETVYDVAEIVG